MSILEYTNQGREETTMKRMIIYEPAMCCPTGICGVGIDPELLRMTNVLGNLQSNGISVGRYNLTSAPQLFIKNEAIGKMLNDKGVSCLPITTVDGEILKSGAYPTNEEIVAWLEIADEMLEEIKINSSKDVLFASAPCCPEGDKCL